jgi:O-antigen/teichoic acid export membrane protein
MSSGLDGEPDVLDTPRAGRLVIRGGALRLASYGVGTLAGVGATAVLLRRLSLTDAGRYNTVVSLLAIVAGLVDAGMTNIGIREWALRRDAERDRVMRDLLGVRLALTAAGVAGAVAFAAIAGYDGAMVTGTLLAGVGLVLLIVANTLQVPLAAELRLGWVAAIDLLRNVLSGAALAALALAGAGIVALLAVPIPVGVVLVAVAGVLVRGRMPALPALHLGRWRALVADALPYAVATAVGFIYVYMTVIVLGFVASQREVGIFSAAFRVFAVLVGMAGLVQQSAFPVLARSARDDRERLRYAVQKLLDGSLVLGALVALGTAVGAPVAIDVVAGARFGEAVPALRIQGAALLMTFLAALGSFALLGMHRYRAVLVANGLALVTSLGLVLTLGAEYGATGAAWANLGGETVLAAATLAAVARGADGVPLSFRTAAPVALALAAGVAVAALLPAPALVDTAAAVAACAAVLLVTRAVPDELLVHLRR